MIDLELDETIGSFPNIDETDLEISFEGEKTLGVECPRKETIFNFLSHLYNDYYLRKIEVRARNPVAIERLREMGDWDIEIDHEIMIWFETPLTESELMKFKNLGKDCGLTIESDPFHDDDPYSHLCSGNTETNNVVNFLLRSNSISEIEDIGLYITKTFGVDFL